MKSAVIVFPGSNCDRDLAVAIERITGTAPIMVWHRETLLPNVDFIGLPGGFSYGDYLRCGAIASRSEIIPEIIAAADRGVPTLGICNGFQVLTEIGLLPGALMRNANLHFVCKDVYLRVENADTMFTNAYRQGDVIRVPIAHHDGQYFASADVISEIEEDGLVAFRYVSADGVVGGMANPNGSLNDIAGILNAKRNVLGMMPHPERLFEAPLGGSDGRGIFESLMNALAMA